MKPVLQVLRKKKQFKTVTKSFRITDEQQQHLQRMKDVLEFEFLGEMLLYCAEIVENLSVWEDEGSIFYVRKVWTQKSTSN